MSHSRLDNILHHMYPTVSTRSAAYAAWDRRIYVSTNATIITNVACRLRAGSMWRTHRANAQRTRKHWSISGKCVAVKQRKPIVSQCN